MKTTLMCLLSFFAWSAAAQFDPITEFSEGEYLGRGLYTSMDDRTDNYASYAHFYADEWVLSYLSGIGMHYYKLNFDFSETSAGYFQLTMQRKTPGPGSGTFSGHGFCGSRQCTLYANLGDGWMQETITFHPENGKVYRLGLFHTPNEVIRWEEEMNHVSANEFDDGSVE